MENLEYEVEIEAPIEKYGNYFGIARHIMLGQNFLPQIPQCVPIGKLVVKLIS